MKISLLVILFVKCFILICIALINQLRYTSTGLHDIVNFALKLVGETLLTQQTVGDMLFGYEDKFLKEVFRIAKDFGFNITSLIPSDVIGLFIGVKAFYFNFCF